MPIVLLLSSQNTVAARQRRLPRCLTWNDVTSRQRPLSTVLAAGLFVWSAAGTSVSLRADPAASQPAVAEGPEDSNASNNGNDLTRPQNSLQIQPNFQTSGSTNEKDRDEVIIQAERKLSVGDWKFAALSQVPVISATTHPSNGDAPEQANGIGDAVFQAIVARQLTDRLAVGIGARFIPRTASDDLGSGKWEIAPGFGVRYSLPEIGADSYFVPAARYVVSFAGDPSRRMVREWQIAPTLNIDLPDKFFLTLYPSNDVRLNEGPPVTGQTGRLFFPADALVGRPLTDKTQVSLEVSVPIIRQFPVYNFFTQLRIRVLY